MENRQKPDESRLYQEEIIYTQNAEGLSEDNYREISYAIGKNNAVGSISGYYDEKLSILHVSSFFLENLGYGYEEFQKISQGSLKALICEEDKPLFELERFIDKNGQGECRMLTRDGTPVLVHLFKCDSKDAQGVPIWILSVRLNWEGQNLSLVNEVIQSGFWYLDCDEDGKIEKVTWSNKFRRMLGFQDAIDFPNQLSAWSELLHPADREETFRVLDQALADKSNQIKYDVTYRLRNKEGRYQWFRANAEIARRKDGTALRMVGIFVNIEQEKRNEIRAQRNAAFHQAHLRGNICEYYVDLRENSFELLDENSPLMDLFETSKSWDELIASYLEHYVCEQDREAVALIYSRDYMLEALGGTSGELSQECRIVLNGQEHWVRNIIMRGNPGDDLRYALGFIQDITDSKKEEENRRELIRENWAMDQLIRGTLRLVSEFAVCDLANNTYEYYSLSKNGVNLPNGSYDSFVKYLSGKYKEASGRFSVEEILSVENIRSILRNEEDIYRLEYCTQDETAYKNLAIIPLEWDKKQVSRVLLVAQDITREKMVEITAKNALQDAYDAANRANRAKTEFLSNMSHDIRTPMNAIVGMTAIAGANIDNREKVLECLEKITKSSRHLLGLLNEVLDMSRIESGKLSLAQDSFRLTDLMDNLVTMIKPGMEERNQELCVEKDGILHTDVCGDSMRIQQIFTNLLSNAMKYTQDGGKIRFAVTEKTAELADAACYEFVVEDNGMGMPPEFLQIIFEPFTRMDDQRTSRIQGTGLGMAITKNLVDMMDGQIEVESKPGEGSRFSVTLCLKLQQGNAGDQEAESMESDGLGSLADCDYSGKRILLVEDNALNCEIAQEFLSMTGAAVEIAGNGKEAVEKVETAPEGYYDLIFMDIQMPVMNGYAAAAAIRALGSSYSRRIPIIAMTANAFAEDVLLAKNAGMNEHMAKPIDLKKLKAVLRRWL